MKNFRTFLVEQEETNSKLIALSKGLMQKFNIDLKTFHQKLNGGQADNVTIEDLANIPIETFIKGIMVELEHTNDPAIALEIVMDHLFEKVPESFKYYDYLDKMEKDMEQNN